MSERDRLIELLLKAHVTFNTCGIADFLLDEGIIASPCKIGDTTWFIAKKEKDRNFRIFEGWVGCIDLRNNSKHVIIHWTDYQDEYKHIVTFDDFGKTVFLNQQDAEKALKTLEEDNYIFKRG